MERFELENSREFKAAQELEDALNNMSWNSEKFAESVMYYHRTLQQKHRNTKRKTSIIPTMMRNTTSMQKT